MHMMKCHIGMLIDAWRSQDVLGRKGITVTENRRGVHSLLVAGLLCHFGSRTPTMTPILVPYSAELHEKYSGFQFSVHAMIFLPY